MKIITLTPKGKQFIVALVCISCVVSFLYFTGGYRGNDDLMARRGGSDDDINVFNGRDLPAHTSELQLRLHYIGRHLDIHYSVLRTVEGYGTPDQFYYSVELTLKNVGTETIYNDGSWTMFMHSPHTMFQVPHNVVIEPVLGDLYEFHVSRSNFSLLMPGVAWSCQFDVSFYMLSRSDMLPNWYVTSKYEDKNTKPVILEVTRNLSFVSFPHPSKLLRGMFDIKTFSAQVSDEVLNYVLINYETVCDAWVFLSQDYPRCQGIKELNRFDMNKVQYVDPVSLMVIPTPLSVNHVPSKDPSIVFRLDDMKLFIITKSLNDGVKAFFDKQHNTVTVNKDPMRNVITFALKTLPPVQDCVQSMAYRIKYTAESRRCEVEGETVTAIFYALQTMRGLHSTKTSDFEIIDAPRYKHRSLMIDVARNFFPVSVLKEIMAEMATVKLNVLHLHLTDDQGWRIEIDDLPQLTQVGGHRSHDLLEKKSLMSNLGSGPFGNTSGSGYYSKEDYRTLLRYAVANHITIIPEIDIPGHSHAAIISMRNRKTELKDDTYNLEDLHFSSANKLSIQNFNKNAVNPCMESTYNFIEKVIGSLAKMHQDIQPLRIYHFGGDEVSLSDFEEYPRCAEILKKGEHDTLQIYFKYRVSAILKKLNLRMMAWGDAFFAYDEVLSTSSFSDQDVYAEAWMIKYGKISRAYTLANNGYKVVLALGDKLYFDHPQEPHIEETGLYWATRYINTKKVFTFNAHHIYNSMDTTSKYACEGRCVQLLEPKNIIGIEGCLWMETVRDLPTLQIMIYPRLHAMAERAWHKADWESDTQLTTDHDWSRFSHYVGTKLLKRLEKKNLRYHLGIPAVKLLKNVIEICGEFHGMNLKYSTDRKLWQQAVNKTITFSVNNLYFLTRSFNEKFSTDFIEIEIQSGTYEMIVY